VLEIFQQGFQALLKGEFTEQKAGKYRRLKYSYNMTWDYYRMASTPSGMW